MSKSFLELYNEEKLDENDLCDWIKSWEAGDKETPLHEFLGISKRQLDQYYHSTLPIRDILSQTVPEMDWARSKKYVHQSIRNILNNEFKISRDYVDGLIRERMNAQVSQWLEEHNVKKLIAEAIIHEVKYKSPLSYKGWTRDKLWNEIKYMMTNALENLLREKITIEAKINE